LRSPAVGQPSHDPGRLRPPARLGPVLGRVQRLARDAKTRLHDQRDLRLAGHAFGTAYPAINALFVRIVRKTGVRPSYLW
jgi:hypothetical protein